MAFITNIRTSLGLGPGVTGTYTADGKPQYVDNDDGNVRGGGAIATTDRFSASTFGEGNPVITIVSGVGGVVSANAAASINAGTQVINSIQTTIAGLSNTALQGAQSNSADNAFTPLQATTVRTYYYKQAVIAGNWNVFTGAFSSVTNNTSSGVWDIAASFDDSSDMRASGTDIAANPTQGSPGRLTYRDGSPNPTNDAYGARYNW